ncbi:MAG TPA: hypothetical protein VKS60_04625 [Stellaceae bacterium]|nr:hypothetical protein [Stellaceae bacterium]
MGVLLLNLVKWLAGLAIPALLAMYVPRRWLIATLAAWSLLPLIVLLVLLAGEILRSPSELAHTDGILMALLVYGGFLVVPWLVMSVMGGAVGLALRRPDTGSQTVTAPAAAPAASPPRDAPARPAAVPPPLSQWRARHVGFERDGLVLDGLDVWGSKWHRLGAAAVNLPHPAHPHELHRFEIYEAGEGRHVRRFAAAELSNGVWGFYTGSGADAPPGGISADGTLGFENLLPGPTERDRLAPTGRIWRVATGEVLADGSAWISSLVVPGADGSLLFALRHFNNDALFRLHPATDSFSVVGELRPDEPLDRLADSVDRALRAITDRAHRNLGLRLSPDGSIRVELASVEWSNTHWVNSPRVVEVATGRVLLDLWGTDWDADASFPLDRSVALDLRRYHFGGSCQASLHLAADNFTIFEDAPAPRVVGPIAGIVPALEAASRRSSALAPRAARTPRPVGRRQLLIALAILVGALAAIAGISFVVVTLTPAPPPPKLSTVPEMPH